MFFLHRAPFSRIIASVVIAIAIGVQGCRTADAPGSYPAANRADCLPSNLTLVDQFGHAVPLASLKGKPVLIDFVYASCASTCPILTGKMAQVARLLGPELGSQVRIVSITLDPEHDNPAGLLNYAQHAGAKGDGWLFLTGKPEQIDQLLAVFGLRRDRDPDGTITHNVAAFLLGADGSQVRQYNGLDVSAKTIIGDIDRARKHG